jgi:hypothetical protein
MINSRKLRTDSERAVQYIDRELSEVITHGAALLPWVQDMVAQCTTLPDPTGDLARTVGAVASEYLALRKRLWAMPEDPLVNEVDRLLAFHQQLLEQASMLAFRPRSASWEHRAGRFGSCHTQTSDRLLELAARC